MAREEPVLGADPGIQRQLRDAVRDECEVGDLLDVLGEELEEARVVDGVIGYAPAPSLAAVSISTTAALPSMASTTPGNGISAAVGGASVFLAQIFMRPRSA